MIIIVKVTDNIVKTITVTAIVSVIVNVTDNVIITDTDIDIVAALLSTLIFLLYC